MNLNQHTPPDPQMQVPKWDVTAELSEYITAGIKYQGLGRTRAPNFYHKMDPLI